jgi:hypothetical protein
MLFGLVFYVFDAALLALCALLLWRMPESPSEEPADALARSWSPVVGVIAMLRGGWRLISLVPVWSFLMSEDSTGTMQLLMMAVVVTTLALVFVGFLTAQRTILQKISSVSVRDTLGDIVGACWGARRAIAIAAVVVGIAQLVPSFNLL